MRTRREILVSAAAVLAASAQDPGSALSQTQFEVASIKPNTSLDKRSSIDFSGGGTLTASNVTLRTLIKFAYSLLEHQLVGGPRWVETDRWDLFARASRDAAVAEPQGYSGDATQRRRVRLRALLADRFQLKVHSDIREMPVYVLVVAKGGARLTPSKSETRQVRAQPGLLTGQKVTMKELAELVLSQRMGQTVIDQTELSEAFNFKIKYDEDASERLEAAADAASEPVEKSFLTAMEDQLGLKLQTQKGRVDIVVIDRVEKASEN